MKLFVVAQVRNSCVLYSAGRLHIFMRSEEAPPDMDEKDYRRVERERRRSSLAKGKERRSSKAGNYEEAWTC